MTKRDPTPRPHAASNDRAAQQELERLRGELALSEAACSDAEARYTALFDGSRDAIVVADHAGIVIEANAAAAKFWGYSREEMLGLDCRCLHPDATFIDNLIGELSNGDFVDDLEIPTLRKDGTTLTALVSASVRRSECGRVIGLQALIHDITGRRATEEALRKSEEMYRSLFEESQDVVYITSRDGKLIDISPSAAELFGHPRVDLLKMDVHDLYAYPEDRRRFQEAVEASGAVRSFPVRLRRNDGSVRFCLLTSTVRRTPNGEAVGYHGIMRDITDQRRSDRARERERAAFRLIAEAAVRTDNIPDLCSRVLEGLLGTYHFDIGIVRKYDGDTGKLITVALVGDDEATTGGPSEESIDDPVATAALVARTGVPIFAPSVDGKQLSDAHRAHLKQLGAEAMVSHPMVGPKGELLGVMQLAARSRMDLGSEDEAVFQTIAEMFAAVVGRATALREKEEMRAQLLQAQKLEAIGTLASGVAHDFNNILTAIQGFADLALMSVDREAQIAEDLDKIRGSAERGSKLVRQLLMFSRRQPVEFGSVDLNSIVQGLTRMLSPLIGEDVSMNVVLERDVWETTADEAGMQQVLMNLAVNARDAMPEGGLLTIRTDNVIVSPDERHSADGAGGTEGRFVRLSVTDTGVGMDEETCARVFEPFFSTKGPAKGTGLGLAVVYGIVQQHHGWIDVESTPGEGTTFSVCLPATSMPEPERVSADAATAQERGRGERILVVEDERTVRDLAVRILRQNGYEVLEAATVGDALAIAEQEAGTLDLVFSDVVLPDRSGVHLAEMLADTHPDLPVLLSSGHADERSQYDAIRQGNLPFLPKPYSLPELLEAVARIVRPN